MIDHKLDNGLTLVKLNTIKNESGPFVSFSKHLKDYADLAQYAVFYFDYGIKFGIRNGDKITFSDNTIDLADVKQEYLQLARIFDKNMELKIWRDGEGKHFFRLCQDSEDTNGTTEAVRAQQILWGTKSVNNATQSGSFMINETTQDYYWHTLTEDRGTQLVIPMPHEILALDSSQPDQRVAVQTYNYIDYLDNGLASYVDCRFVRIDIWKEGE